MCACTTTRSVSVPTLEPEIREVERLVREQVETPPAECLREPVEPEAMQPGRDWRDVALINGQAARINQAIAEACQGHWARARSDRSPSTD